MTSAWLLYLAAATGCQLGFALLYRLALASLSTFGWQRAYLLGALLLSALLPLLAPPAAWVPWPGAPAAGPAGLPAWSLAGAHAAAGAVASSGGSAPAWSWLPVVLAAYWLGVAWRVGRTARSLGGLYWLRRQQPRTRLGPGWLVQLPAPGRPAFSFGRYVFLSPAHAQLSPAEYAQLVQHEQAHGAQHHSLDLLLAEGLGWFFWFNGLAAYLGRQLRTVHEYLADAAVAPPAGQRAAYGHLLLKLAAPSLPGGLVHSFATRQVARRIRMLTSPPSSTERKLRFLLALPVAAAAWLGTAALGPRPAATARLVALPVRRAAPGRIGTITWQGNAYLSDAQLAEALGLKPGDPFEKYTLEAYLANREDQCDITSRYMNNGYLFFQINPVATPQPDGTTNLLFKITEGPTARLNTLTVRGNRRVATADVLKLVPLRRGELFSRARLVQSQRALAESGYFVPTAIGVSPQPLPAQGLVNIELVVVEK